ncbi:MAG: EAL domain-containing protein [Sedimenticola sp.]
MDKAADNNKVDISDRLDYSCDSEDNSIRIQRDGGTNRRISRRHWPLWLHVLIALSSVYILATYLAGVVTSLSLEEHLEEDVKQQTEQAFSLFSGAAIEAVISEDIPVLFTIAEESGRIDEHILRISIQNEQGYSLVDWHRPNSIRVDNIKTYDREIVFEGEVFGTISIDWDFSSVMAVAQEHVWSIQLLVSVVLLVFTVIVIVLVHTLTVRPVRAIHIRLQALKQGDLEGKLSIHTSQELSMLASSVNTLAESIKLRKQREKELLDARAQLFEAKEHAEVTLHSIGDGVITTDNNGVIQYLNPVAETLTGWSLAEAKGKALDQVFHIVNEITGLPSPNPVTTCLREGRTIELENHTVLLSASGIQFAIEDSASPIRSRDGEILGAVLVFHDVTQARKMSRAMEYQASHDSLTGLVNRGAFIKHLNHCLDATFDTRVQHALLYLDLDQFKLVNDTSGHVAGDALLQQLTPLLVEQIRRGDVFARLGGDEFGVLLLNCPEKSTKTVASKLLKTVSDFRFSWEEKAFSLGVSIGVVPFASSSPDAETLLKAADQACYAAKEAGRNRVHLFNINDTELARREGEMQWVSRIQEAINQDLFTVYCQRIHPINSALHQVQYETLIRLNDSDTGVILPGAFLPSAERYGLMHEIDNWMIDSVFEWLKDNQYQIDQLDMITINLSGTSLSQEGFAQSIITRIEKAEVDPNIICFEITETVAVAHLGNAREFMAQLHRIGCRFALDDFGSGMSSFGYLRNLPVDILKIDGSFTVAMLNDDVSLAMISSINDIGHVMGKETIAEFVENSEMLDKLREIGVDYAQGFGIEKPIPLDSLITKRASHHRS